MDGGCDGAFFLCGVGGFLSFPSGGFLSCGSLSLVVCVVPPPSKVGGWFSLVGGKTVQTHIHHHPPFTAIPCTSLRLPPSKKHLLLLPTTSSPQTSRMSCHTQGSDTTHTTVRYQPLKTCRTLLCPHCPPPPAQKGEQQNSHLPTTTTCPPAQVPTQAGKTTSFQQSRRKMRLDMIIRTTRTPRTVMMVGSRQCGHRGPIELPPISK